MPSRPLPPRAPPARATASSPARRGAPRGRAPGPSRNTPPRPPRPARRCPGRSGRGCTAAWPPRVRPMRPANAKTAPATLRFPVQSPTTTRVTRTKTQITSSASQPSTKPLSASPGVTTASQAPASPARRSACRSDGDLWRSCAVAFPDLSPLAPPARASTSPPSGCGALRGQAPGSPRTAPPRPPRPAEGGSGCPGRGSSAAWPPRMRLRRPDKPRMAAATPRVPARHPSIGRMG